MTEKDELLFYFLEGLDLLETEIQAYQQEPTLWKVAPGTNNSAGNLCYHLIGNLHHFIGAALGNTGYMRDRKREFEIKDVPQATLIEYIERTRKMLKEVFRSIERLEAAYPEGFRLEPTGSVRYQLLRLLKHFYYHLGQINYHRRILQA